MWFVFLFSCFVLFFVFVFLFVFCLLFFVCFLGVCVFFVFFFCHSMQGLDVGSQSPDQGLNLGVCGES